MFLALAIGILIGAEFGGDVVSNTRKDLEKSLTGNLADARSRADELAARLGDAEEFADRIYPILVQERLAGRRIGVLGLGGLPGSEIAEIESALEPTGAKLVAVGVTREPPDVEALAGDLAETRFADVAGNPETVQALGTGVGRQLVIGGTLLDRLGSKLFSRVSGRFGNLDGMIVVRDQPEQMTAVERDRTNRLETGLLDGVSGTSVNAVGVEPSDADPSSVAFFGERGISTVDDVDLAAGRVATVFALLGAEGDFGVNGSADRLLPDLLTPGPVVPPSKPNRGGNGGGGAAVGPGRAAATGQGQ